MVCADKPHVKAPRLLTKPWIAVQVLGVLMMLHAAALLALMGEDATGNLQLLGWVFLSLGVWGFGISLAARTWMGWPTIAWSSGISFFGSLALLSFSAPQQRDVAFLVAMVVLGSGLTHWAGALRLHRQEERYRPYVCSGAANIVIAAIVMLSSGSAEGFPVCSLVAGATFTSGLTLYHYGRLLRRLASTGASMMDLLERAVVPRVRHGKARL